VKKNTIRDKQREGAVKKRLEIRSGLAKPPSIRNNLRGGRMQVRVRERRCSGRGGRTIGKKERVRKRQEM